MVTGTNNNTTFLNDVIFDSNVILNSLTVNGEIQNHAFTDLDHTQIYSNEAGITNLDEKTTGVDWAAGSLYLSSDTTTDPNLIHMDSYGIKLTRNDNTEFIGKIGATELGNDVFYITSNHKNININPKTASVLLTTEDVLIGNGSGNAKITLNSEVQNYAFTDVRKIQIETNTTNIGTNTSNIGTNTSNIGTNATNIGTNTTNIGNNTTNIGTNTTNIGNNTTNISTNTTNIGTNTTNIGNLTTSIGNLNHTGSTYDLDETLVITNPDVENGLFLYVNGFSHFDKSIKLNRTPSGVYDTFVLGSSGDNTSINHFNIALDPEDATDHQILWDLSPAGVVTLSNNLILRGTGKNITLNAEVQNYAFTDVRKTQIETNTSGITTLESDIRSIEGDITTNTTNISTNTTNITANTNSIIVLNSKAYEEFTKNSAEMVNLSFTTNGVTVGSFSHYYDYHLGADLLNTASAVIYFSGGFGTTGEISADWGVLNIAYDITYSNSSGSSTSYFYMVQSQIIIEDSAGTLHYSTPLIGIKTSNTPSCVHIGYSLQNNALIKYQSSFLGKFLKIRTQIKILTAPVGTNTLVGSIKVSQL
jgi:hypothetical protein